LTGLSRRTSKIHAVNSSDPRLQLRPMTIAPDVAPRRDARGRDVVSG
jgi:hypothetical protein